MEESGIELSGFGSTATSTPESDTTHSTLSTSAQPFTPAQLASDQPITTSTVLFDSNEDTAEQQEAQDEPGIPTPPLASPGLDEGKGKKKWRNRGNSIVSLRSIGRKKSGSVSQVPK